MANEITAGLLTAIAKETTEQIEIGGRNMLLGTKDFSGFYLYPTTLGKMEENSFSIVDFPALETATNRWVTGAKSPLELEDVWGKEVVFSYELRSEETWSASGLNVCVEFGLCNNASTSRLKYRIVNVETEITPEWTRHVVKVKLDNDFFTGGSGALEDCTRFWVRAYNTTVKHLQMRKFKLELGNVATAWTPAPEDLESRINQAELKVTPDAIISTVSSTYTTKEEFENLQVGGRNMIKGANPFYVSTNVKDNAVVNEQSLELVYGDSSKDTWFELRLYDTVKAGEEYTLSFDCEGIEEGVTPVYYIQGSKGTPNFTLTNGRVKHTFKLNKENATGYLLIDDVNTSESRPSNTRIVLSNPKLEKGNKATDWTPAPDDFNVEIGNVQREVKDLSDTLGDSVSTITQLSNSISTLVRGENGQTLMSQDENGWYFNIEDLNEIKSYVRIGKYQEDGGGPIQPCLELGQEETTFRLIITNTKFVFLDGSFEPAWFTNEEMHIKKAAIEEELIQGGFIWKTHGNGNLGLLWKGVN